MRLRPRRALSVAIMVLPVAQAMPANGQAYRFQNPFHPIQCDKAIESASLSLERNATDSEARLILAEGLLCCGLEGDRRSLERAIDRLREIVAHEPGNFFAQLELADAMRKHDPVSDEAEQSLWRAAAMLPHADVGAARGSLDAYIAENLAAITETRRRLARFK